MFYKKDLLAKYSNRLRQFNTPNEASGYANRYTQHFRFKILTEIADLYGRSPLRILDYGCGTGELLDYLICQGFRGDYVGVDLNPDVIAYSKKRFKDKPKARFLVIRNARECRRHRPDFTFISGVFNDAVPNSESHLIRTVHELFTVSKQGLAFNALSRLQCQKKDRGFAYFDPARLLRDFLRRSTPFVTLRHDYRMGNFSMFLKKRGEELQF